MQPIPVEVLRLSLARRTMAVFLLLFNVVLYCIFSGDSHVVVPPPRYDGIDEEGVSRIYLAA